MSTLGFLDVPCPSETFLLLQSSASQSCLPILSQTIRNSIDSPRRSRTLLFSLLYPPEILLSGLKIPKDLKVYDWLNDVPQYSSCTDNLAQKLISAVEHEIEGEDISLVIILDSVDVLVSDLGSTSKAYSCLQQLMKIVYNLTAPSRLMLHIQASSPMLPLISGTAFSSQIVHITAYPCSLIRHIAKEYLTVPPFNENDEVAFNKFYGVFLPLTERWREIDQLVFNASGEGSGDASEFVLDVLIRTGMQIKGRKKGVERFLKGWVTVKGSMTKLHDISGLTDIWRRRGQVVEVSKDPTRNLSFNLNLTTEQEQSRAQVPAPYAHDGKPSIYYDPDSADDLDDDDPDEDLDI